MMQSSTTAPARSKTRKMAMQMVVGAIAGATVTFVALRAIEGSGFDLDNPSRVIALLVGIVLLLTGAFVGMGAALPGPGSQLLNVEDADELREMRRPLWRGAIVMVLIGTMMAVLGLAGSEDWPGLVSPGAAALVVGACVVGTMLLSYAGRNDHDELMRSVAQQGAAWAMYASLTIFTVWGSLAHLGYLPWITPLGMVAALIALQLLVIFAACAARGLLKPR